MKFTLFEDKKNTQLPFFKRRILCGENSVDRVTRKALLIKYNVKVKPLQLRLSWVGCEVRNFTQNYKAY